MSAPVRETAGSVRSANVAHFLPPVWGRVVRHLLPALERVQRDAATVQLLVIVPDAPAAIAVARACSALDTGAALRIVAGTSAARTRRMLAQGPQVVIGPPAALAPAVAASALKLEALQCVAFVSADELEAEGEELASLMAEVPRGSARLLTALQPTPGVEALLERYLHRARRVQEEVAPPTEGGTATVVRYLTVSGAPGDALAGVLDEVDAPSATVLVADEAGAQEVRDRLRAIGYHDESLARVTTGQVAMNSALVVVLGVPTTAVWVQAVAALPAQLIAIIAPREVEALRLLAGASEPRPFSGRGPVQRARAADARARAELRALLADGIPTREVLALEPLLGEHDGLEIAAAALRLLETARAEKATAVREVEQRLRQEMKEAEHAERADRPEREERAPRPYTPRGDKPRGFAPRGDRPREYTPRGDKPRGDKPREYTPRGDKPREYTPRGDKPRGFAPRGDKARGYVPREDRSGSDRPRGDKPRGFAPRGDKPGGDRPRGPRGADARGRPPRGDR